MKKAIILSIALSMSLVEFSAQPGPGGVGDLSGTSLLKIWVTSESANVITNDTPVDTLYDLSGTNNHLIADNESARPLLLTAQLNGFPSISFNGVDQYLRDAVYDSSFYNDEATLIAIVSSQSQGTIVSVASTGVFEEFLMLSGKAYHHSFDANYNYLDHECNLSNAQSPFKILTGEFGRTISDLALYYNQVASTESILTSSSPTDFIEVDRLIYVGLRQVVFPGEHFNGELVELIGYNRKLTELERTSVLDYLSNKYLLPVDCGLVSSINELKGDYGIHIYPNPSSGRFTFESDFTEGEIEIYTVLGEKIYSEPVSFATKNEIDLSQVSAGLYFVKISNGKNYYTQHIIVEMD